MSISIYTMNMSQWENHRIGDLSDEEETKEQHAEHLFTPIEQHTGSVWHSDFGFPPFHPVNLPIGNAANESDEDNRKPAAKEYSEPQGHHSRDSSTTDPFVSPKLESLEFPEHPLDASHYPMFHPVDDQANMWTLPESEGHVPAAASLPQRPPDFIIPLDRMQTKFQFYDHNTSKEKMKPHRRTRRSIKHAPPISTSSGERTSQMRVQPLQEEYSKARTQRDRKALESWYRHFQELIEYQDEHGNCNVPQIYEPNKSLGVWVNKQRMEKKKMDDGEPSTMTEQKLAALKQIGFQWAKRKGDHSWNEKYEELVQFKQEKGHCNVNTKYKKNPALGRWVSTQRSQYKSYKEGGKSLMNEERIRKLDEIGFRWNMLDRDQSTSEESPESERTNRAKRFRRSNRSQSGNLLHESSESTGTSPENSSSSHAPDHHAV